MPVKCTRIELNSSSCLSCLKFLCSPFLGLVSLFFCFFFFGYIYIFILLFVIVFFLNPSYVSFFFSRVFFISNDTVSSTKKL
jgi:hypothetical protein